MELIPASPIMMNPDSVQGLLDKRKRQTRRPISTRNSFLDGRGVGRGGAMRQLWQSLAWEQAWVDPGPSPAGNPGPYLRVPCPADGTVRRVYSRWRVGGKLWVKEAWGVESRLGDHVTVVYRAGQGSREIQLTDWDGDLQQALNAMKRAWRPSMFMPRWASRFLLEVVEARPQRLQDISFDDCLAEGVLSTSFWGMGANAPSGEDLARLGQERPPGFPLLFADPVDQGWEDYTRLAYAHWWDSLNAGRGKGWDLNPWVWVLAFQALEPPNQARVGG